MSSGATKRTSMGKLTIVPVRSIHALTARTASGPASRGTAYSISEKRTYRGLANTLKLWSTYSTRPLDGSARASRGTRAGRRRPIRLIAPKATFDSSTSSLNALTQRRGASGSSVRLLALVSAQPVWGT
jgi:hypothetical protein